MTKPSTIILVPKYMEHFQCIGSSCEDTCCVGWGVPIDKATYKKYKKVKDPELTQKIENTISRNRTNPTDHHYASILLSGCQGCGMLSEEGLCEIQLKLGEDYLSTTCAAYPRVTNVINGHYEQSACLSCPEAARLALLNPEPMEFFEIHAKPNEKFSLQTVSNPESFQSSHIQHHFWGLRIFSIEIMQKRNYSLTNRVLLLGLFMQNVQDCMSNETISHIPLLIEHYRQMVQDGSLRDSLNQIPVEVNAQIQLLRELMELRLHLGTENKRYLDCFQLFLEGISYNEGSSIEHLAENYQSAYTTYYKPFMENHSYILENYIVNNMYKSTFPFYGGVNVMDNFFSLSLHYSLIKMHLIGLAGYYKENLNVQHVVTFIQSFSKVVEHNERYLQYAFDYLKKRDFLSIAGMAIFLKN